MHQETWAVFPGEIDESPALFRVDVGWLEEGPDTTRRWWLCVQQPFTSTNEDGLGTAQALDHAAAFEDRLVPLVEKACSAIIVGTVTTDGTRTFCFYGKTKAGLEAAAAAAALGSKVEVQVEDDPQWEQFEETLAPDESQFRYINDMTVIQQLVENGDTLTTPRDIEHLAVFPSAGARDKFGDWCKKNGFKVANAYKVDDADRDSDDDGDDSDPLVFALEFVHRAPADIDAITPMTTKATDAADDFGGCYDGWQSAIVKGRR